MATPSPNPGANTLGDDSFMTNYTVAPSGYTFGVNALTPINDYLSGVSCLEQQVHYGDLASPMISTAATLKKRVVAEGVLTVAKEHHLIRNIDHNELYCGHVANRNDVFSAMMAMMRWAAVLAMIVFIASLVLM